MDSAFEVISEVISEGGGEIEQERGTTCPHSFVVPVVHRNAAAATTCQKDRILRAQSSC